MNKSNLKNVVLVIGVLLLGTFSVTIANLFNGYYCGVAALAVLLSTIYLFDVLDKRGLEENKINLIMVGGVVFFEVLFFLVNDIFGKTVYGGGSIGFFEAIVLFSQLYSVVGVIYYVLKNVLFAKRVETIELVENHKEEPTTQETEIEEEDELEINNVDVEEIKRLPQGTLGKETPFMEEEK